MSVLNLPKIIAHRGASKEAPENTIAAINRALSLDVNCVEIDVRLSKDGIPIVLHDSSTSRMTGIKNTPLINLLNLSEIQQIDVGQRFGKAFTGEKIPTLFEVLNLNWKNTGLMIEIKECPQEPKIVVEAVFNVLSQIEKLPTFLVLGSFSIEILIEVKKHLTKTTQSIETIGIIEKQEMILPFVELNLKRLAIWNKLINEELIQFLKDKEIDIWTFTVDDLKAAKFLIALGINGIISNVPKKMIESRIFHLH